MTDTANAPEREAGTPGPHEPDYKTAMLYHSDRADAYMGERDALTAELAKLRADLAEAQAKIARLAEALEILRDNPAAVHINMLKGSVARPTWEQIKHLYCAEFKSLQETPND